MKRLPLNVCALLLALMVLAGGCKSSLSPLQEAQVAADTLSATQTAIEAAGRSGLISPQTVLDTEPYEHAALAAVNAMFEAAEAGSPNEWPSDFWHAARAFYAELAKLKSVQLQAERAGKVKPPSATIAPAPARPEENSIPETP